jgi:predicted metalloenzyme YecM
LSKLEIDVSKYQADHICWRTESIEEYSELITTLKSAPDSVSLLIESEIGGRPIATFHLADAIQATEHHTINILEIPAPKEGRSYKSGLEHVEFVIGDGNADPGNSEVHRAALDDFMKAHPLARFDTKARETSLNPDVSVSLDLDAFGTCSVKFHLVPLAKLIEYESRTT